jgi:hypothetical protein
MIERGTIQQINTRGRVTLRLADRLVVADLHSGSGGSVGDLIEGDMRPGLQSWRNVGNSNFSVVQVVSIDPVNIQDRSHDATTFALGPRSATPVENRRATLAPALSADQNSRRKFS